MISRDFVTEWRQFAPWVRDVQVELDLVISRALVEMFREPAVRQALAFRGATALYKLHFTPPPRFSEDIDLVQVRPEPVGSTLTAIRAVLDPWLGTPRRDVGRDSARLLYRMSSGGTPPQPMRLKIEINLREPFTVFGHQTRRLQVASRWFSGETEVPTFALDELLATKLRALYQRRKGRDLFDLWYALLHANVPCDRVVEAFRVYLEREGHRISRAEFEGNLFLKMQDRRFSADIENLLTPESAYDPQEAYRQVSARLIARLPGDPWRGAEPV